MLKPRIEFQFQTHPVICQYMVGMIPNHCHTILEPTKGQGNIVRELNNRKLRTPEGIWIDRFSITSPQDYFLLDPTLRFDAIVMNPPFSGKSLIVDNAPKNVDLSGMKGGYYILEECMKKSNHIIALMPWFLMLDSDSRTLALLEFGLKSITALPRKAFNYARIQTMILELEKGYTGPVEYKYFTHPTWERNF